MKARLTYTGEQCAIALENETLMPVAYMSYAPLKENLDEMKRIGVRLFMFPIYAGDEGINMESGLRPLYDGFFKGYGEYDFTVVDEMLSRLAPTGKEDVFVIPRVCLEPPIWWQRLHPDEVARDSRGEAQRECFASKKWLSDMTVALEALIDHLRASKWAERIIGYHIAAGGTEEWAYQCRYDPQYYDYSEVNLRAYREFLRARYGSLAAIAAAHKKDYKKFEDIRFPHPVEREYAKNGYLRDPDTERAVLDYYDYHNESVADAILYFCRAAKEYTGGEQLVGAFYGYVFAMPQNFKGLHALGKVLASPYIDFLSTTNCGAHWSFSSAVESARLHKKLWMCEGDIRTCLSAGMGKNLAHAMPDNDYYDSAVWHGPETVKGSVDKLTQALARIATASVGIWWFDMFGGWFKNEEMQRVIARSIPLLAEQKNELFVTEVAFVVDERGHKYSSLDARSLLYATRELTENMELAGFPYDNYLLSDIADPAFPADKYRLIIFLAAVDPADRELSAIAEKLKRDGKTLLFLGSSGAHSEALCEFSLEARPEYTAKKADFRGEVYPKHPTPAPTLVREEGYVLSRFEDGAPAVLWKACDGYHAVLSLPLAMPSSLLRHIALLAGVHLYNRNGDAVFAGGEYIGLWAKESGYRRICLPEADLAATDFMTGKSVTVNDRFVDLWMEKDDMRLLHFEKKSK